MKVNELIALLGKYPQDAEVWYIEATYGMPSRKVKDYHIEMQNGKLILGYDGMGGGDVD